MDGMLTQDEINALLTGMDGGSSGFNAIVESVARMARTGYYAG